MGLWDSRVSVLHVEGASSSPCCFSFWYNQPVTPQAQRLAPRRCLDVSVLRINVSFSLNV